MTIEKRKLLEEPIIEFEDEDDEKEDLSWMIQNNDQNEIKNKKTKGNK